MIGYRSTLHALLTPLLTAVLLGSPAFFFGKAATAESTGEKPLFEATFDDATGSGGNGTHHGAVTLVEGREGKCAFFDGRSWIDTGVVQSALGSEFTVECWVNPAEQQHPNADIFGNHLDQGVGFVLEQDGVRTNQFLAANGAGENAWVLTDAVQLGAGRWQHVALVKTERSLRFYLNGVLVAEQEDMVKAGPSPMPIAVGLGYSDEKRCFQGLIDDFRIYAHALADFQHAGIDAEASQETRARHLSPIPRSTADAPAESWTLATEDTRLTLGVTDEGELVIGEVSNPAVRWNWVTNPIVFGFWTWGDVEGKAVLLKWRFLGGVLAQSDGQILTLRFACDDPALELASSWHARPGPGPIHHSMNVTNHSTQLVTLGEQSTFDLDVTGATALWSFHSDGPTVDPVGVYRHALGAGKRYAVRTTPEGDFIPYVVLDAAQQHGMYIGLEWSFCRIEAVSLAEPTSQSVRVRAGNVADMRAQLRPGETLEVRPGFLGAYRGDLDNAGNRLRRWLFQYGMPDVLRQDSGYPKVQWNAFGATGKGPGNWDSAEKGYYPLIDEIAPLGFEEVMIDVGWWQGGEPDFDQADWPSGMRKAAEYAHENGLRFGLYWTDNLDMSAPSARQQRAERIHRLFDEYDADIWRSDATSGAVIGASYAATLGFYEMVDTLASEIPGFQWENCSNGGRLKDYGAMKRAVKVFNSDTYSALHVRQAFHDTTYAFHSIQVEGHFGSTDRRMRPQGVAAMRYAFRSTSMGAPEWFLDAPNGGNGTKPWTQEEKDTLKACVNTYKDKIRPLLRSGDLYHIFQRPDGRRRDGIEYYDPATAKGVIYLFQPTSEEREGLVRFKGLNPELKYRVRFEDNSNPSCVEVGAVLMETGVKVTLEGEEMSELIFFEADQ